MDRWVISDAEKAKLFQQFQSLGPINGYITGDKAKGFMLKSQLPPQMLAQIWALADADCDGRLDTAEFFIACKIISLKLQGVEIPSAVPPSLKTSAIQKLNSMPGAALVSPPLLGTAPVTPLMQPMNMTGVGTPPLVGGLMSPPQMPSMPLVQPSFGTATRIATVAPIVSSQPLSNQQLLMTSPPTNAVEPLLQFGSPPLQNGSIAQAQGAPGLPVYKDTPEWGIPQQTKLKYAQLFNSLDRNNTGFLTGIQARGVLVQSQLPQVTLAKIWTLSDIDTDGKLSCEEFILAMHLCDLARTNEPLPSVLPNSWVPPSFRKGFGAQKTRAGSLASIGSGDDSFVHSTSSPSNKEDGSMLSPVSFEDRRKENFDRGQAELERRRKALEDAQKREREERERKEREEMERQEKIRLEQERRKHEELQRQLEKQRELEVEREKERLRQIEQREAARRELERQRQMEWESQRLQELLVQRQAEMEKLTSLRAKNQTLTLELCQLHEKVTTMSNKILDTRTGVAEIKTTIDGMRGVRDSHVAELTQLKARMRDQNARLLTLSQERAKLEAKNKLNSAKIGEDNGSEEVVKRRLNVAALREKLAILQAELTRKKEDKENNNSRLEEIQKELKDEINKCRKVKAEFDSKRSKVLELRASQTQALISGAGWESNQWDESPIKESQASFVSVPSQEMIKYRALYSFDARNTDELSFLAGDIITASLAMNAEPGWLSGELNGQVGWFPEAYVERYFEGAVSSKRTLEGIQEVPETGSDNSSFGQDQPSAFAPITKTLDEASPMLGQGQVFTELYMEAIYNWSGTKENHLSFLKGDIISVAEKQGEWSFGSLNGKRGWFPNTHVVEYTKQTMISEEVTTNEEYVALYPYQSAEVGDLTFQVGEVITVTQKNGDWWTGCIGDRSGIFPSNYVEKASNVGPADEGFGKYASPSEDLAEIELNNEVAVASAEVLYDYQADSVSSVSPNRGVTPSSESGRSGKKPEIATVIAPYTAVESNQLSLQRGQLVLIRKKNPTGWWEGELQAKGKQRQFGWFPSSYVRIMTSSGSARSTPVQEFDDQLAGFSSPAPPTIQVEKVIAMFPYTAQNDDELSLKKDDVIIVINKDDASWWQGELNGVVGLFPSNYVEPYSQNSSTDSPSGKSHSQSADLNPIESKRQASIKELISTEESFVQDLTTVIEVFEKPIAESRVITEEEVLDIFANWEDLIGSSNKLLRALQLREKNSQNGIVLMVGDILCESLPNMSPYIRYCSRQLGAAAFIQNKVENSYTFRDLLKRCQQHPKSKGLPLSAFLLQPVQRITKYPLIIKQILKHTPITHPDRQNLEEALAKAELLCDQVNAGVEQIENAERLEWIQKRINFEDDDQRIVFNSVTNIMGPRLLLHHGFLRKTKSGKELIGFLFNDFLLLTESNKQLEKINFQFLFTKESKMQLEVYKQPIILEHLKLLSEDVDSPLKSELNLYCSASDQKIYMSCGNLNEKNLWKRKIEDACKNYKVTEKARLERQGSTRGRPPVGYLRLLVKDGDKIQRDPNGGKHDSYCQVTLGSQLQKTPIVKGSTAPRFNTSMQFLIKNPKEDVLCLTVYGKDSFKPDEYLGRAEIRIQDMLAECLLVNRPLLKKLTLYGVMSGDIWIKFDIQLFR
ncbi:intersectin-1-like isoform X3 [Artemia franciscana]|uniref:intersectin-1-like isoform X3 n=1 Tax=Artemia franciscana TaxID=6661 RepID=UPI0032DA1BEA